jgi:hypothetical protein
MFYTPILYMMAHRIKIPGAARAVTPANVAAQAGSPRP